MNWRERYRRYRRYGMEPLPADASQQQRDAHATELRQRRRARRRRLAIRSGVVAVALGVLVGGLLYWLLMTIGGRDMLLAQIVARLPAGTTLTWKQAEGPASGPMTLRGVHFSMPRQRDPECVPTATASCAMGRIVFDADTVVLDPAIRPLLGRTLRLDALSVSGARLDLPRGDAPFELPRWPDVLPRIEPPLALRADAIRIDRLDVLREGEPLLAITSARGGLHASSGRLHVERLQVASNRGQFALHGDYVPREDFRADLLATAVLPAPAGRTAPRLGLVAKGDLSRMDVAIAGRMPGPARLTLTLRGDKDAPRWVLRGKADALDPALLAGSEGTPLAFDVAAEGVGGSAEVRGRIARGELVAVVQPSKLQLQEQRLQLQPLVVDVLGGRVTANGVVDLNEVAAKSGRSPPIRLALNARGVRWQASDGATAIHGDADVGIAGTPERWAVKGQARLRRGGERATVALAGRGDRARLQVDALQARMPQGQLDATGVVAWSPHLQWQADATLAGFDPGYFAPDWPGAVRGKLRSSGSVGDDGRLVAQVDARDLGGTLRGRALGGRGQLEIDGDRYAGEVALTLGGSRIDARGRIAAAMDVDVTLAPLQLNDLLPAGRGLLRGTLQLRGPRTAPDVQVALDGSDLAFGDYRAARLSARGQLPWRGGGGRLQVEASALQAGVALDGLRATLTGAVERLAFDVGAQGAVGVLAATGTAARQGSRWQGALETLQLAPTRGVAWSLQAPARWSWDDGNGALSQACLRSGSGGSLCASADWPRRGVDIAGTGLPWTLLSPYLPEREDGRPWVFSGAADLVAQLRPAGARWRGEARITSASGGVRYSLRSRRDLVAYRNLIVQARFDPNRIDATVEAGLDDDGRLEARIATGWDAYAPLDGTLRLRTDELTWLELFSPDIVAPTGRLDADLRLAGTRGQPAIGGSGRLQGFATSLPALGIDLRDGDLRLDAQPDGSARIVGSLRSGDGRLAVDGTLDWRSRDTPLVLNVRGRDVLVSDTRQLRAVAAPDLVVRYRAGQPLQVSGEVVIPEADIHLDRLEQRVKASPDVVVLDPANPRREATPAGIDLDLALVMGDAVRIDGYGLDGRLTGSLRVRQPAGGAMRGTGVLEVDGRYRAYGQNLTITRGRLAWANSPVGDPRVDVRAEREVGEVTAGIRISGRASALDASVYADPARSESEALALLTLGRPLGSLTGSEARQLNAAQSALNVGTGLLAAELGGRLGLDDAGVIESRALGSSVLSVGKYLSPRLYVGYGVSLLGTGQVVMLRYLLRKGFDIQVESSTVENRASLNWTKER